MPTHPHITPGASTLFLLLVAVVVPVAGQCPPWGYGASDGPAVWGELCPAYALCASGLQQAPVDVPSAQVTLDYNMGPLVFDIVLPSDEAGSVQSVQAAYSTSPKVLRVDWVPGSTLTGGPFEHKVYYLTSLSFHSPSEFTVSSYRPDLSIYIYHQTSKKQIAVAVISFNVSSARNGFLDVLIPYLPTSNTTTTNVPLVSLDLAGLVDMAFAGGYFVIPGSLTSPPCSEDVTYILGRNNLSVTADQLQVFANLLNTNIRPIQPLNGRRIKAFVPFSTLDDGRLSKEAGWIFVSVVVGGIVAVGLGSYVRGKAKRPQPHPDDLVLREDN